MKRPTIQTISRRVWRASELASAVAFLPLLACLLLANSARATLPSTDFPNIGLLGDLTELGHPLIEISDMDTNADFTRLTVVRGTIFSDPTLVSDQSQVMAASAALDALTPDQVISADQTSGLSFDVATGQVEVVDLDGGLNLDNQSITLTGGGSLLLNVQDSLSLGGSAGIFGNPDNIYINYTGASTIDTGSGDTVDGLVLDATAPAILDGDWNRGFFGALAGETTVTTTPEPGSVVLVSTALATLLFARFLRRKSKSN